MRFALGGNVIGTLRAALLLLAGLGVVGTAAELAMERHWQGSLAAAALAGPGDDRPGPGCSASGEDATGGQVRAQLRGAGHLDRRRGPSGGTSRKTTTPRPWTLAIPTVGRRCPTSNAGGKSGGVPSARLLFSLLGRSCISALPWLQRPVDWEGRPIQ